MRGRPCNPVAMAMRGQNCSAWSPLHVAKPPSRSLSRCVSQSGGGGQQHQQRVTHQAHLTRLAAGLRKNGNR